MKSFKLASRAVLVIAFSLSSGCMRDIRSDSGIHSYVINTDKKECESNWSIFSHDEFQRLVYVYGDTITIDEQLNGYEGIPGIVRVVNIPETSRTYTPRYSNSYYQNIYTSNSYYTNPYKSQVVLFDGLVSDCMAVANIYESKLIRQSRAYEKEKIRLAKLEEERAKEEEKRRLEEEKIAAKNREYFAKNAAIKEESGDISSPGIYGPGIYEKEINGIKYGVNINERYSVIGVINNSKNTVKLEASKIVIEIDNEKLSPCLIQNPISQTFFGSSGAPVTDVTIAPGDKGLFPLIGCDLQEFRIGGNLRRITVNNHDILD